MTTGGGPGRVPHAQLPRPRRCDDDVDTGSVASGGRTGLSADADIQTPTAQHPTLARKWQMLPPQAAPTVCMSGM